MPPSEGSMLAGDSQAARCSGLVRAAQTTSKGWERWRVKVMVACSPSMVMVPLGLVMPGEPVWRSGQGCEGPDELE